MTVVQHSRSTCVCDASKWRYAGPSKETHERCERPFRLVCVGCDAVVTSRCGRSSRTVCEPCAFTYRRRVRRIFASGWTDNPSHRLYLVTLTAPGNGVHHQRDGEPCPCTPRGGVHLPSWNARAGKGFNRFVQDLRRLHGDVQYARAAEVQKRGALHFHVLVRPPADDPTRRLWAMGVRGNPDHPLRVLAIKHGFGHEVDCQLVRSEGVAGYCAKYVSKSAADKDELPWIDHLTGEVVQGAKRYRPWSASRRWSDVTMKAIRAEQARWVREQLAGEPGPAALQAERAPAAGGVVADGPLPPGRACPLDHNTASYTGEVRCWVSPPSLRADLSTSRRS